MNPRISRALAVVACFPLLWLGLGVNVQANASEGDGETLAAIADASDDIPEVGPILAAAGSIFDFISLCKANEANNIPCTQSTSTTVDEIYTTVRQTYSLLQSFVQQSEANQQEILNALGTVFQSEQYNNFESQWNSVRNDLENAYTGILIYQGLLECMTNLPATATAQPGTCTTYNTSRIPQPGQPATGATVAEAANTLTSFVNSTPWNNTPVNMASNFAGTFDVTSANAAVNPFGNSNAAPQPSVLGSFVGYSLTREANKQGLPLGSNISYFSSSLVNSMSSAVASLISMEAQYFAIQTVAGFLSGGSAQSSAYQNAQGFQELAQTGTTGPQAILSLSQQMATYGFPGWSPSKPLAANEGYLVSPSFGAVLLTNNGTSESAPTTDAGMPTAAQLEQVAGALGPQYHTINKLYPQAVPATPEAVWGNLGATGDTSVGRWWTAPQATWNAGLVNNTGLGAFYRREQECGKTGFACPGWLTVTTSTAPYPVTLLADTHTFNGTEDGSGNSVTWQAPPVANPITKSVPYSIFSAKETAAGSNFYSTAPVVVPGNPFGEPVTLQTVAQHSNSSVPPAQGSWQPSLSIFGNTYSAGSFSMPTWDVYWDGPNTPPFTYGTLGMFVKSEGVSASNVTTSFIQPTGVLQSTTAN